MNKPANGGFAMKIFQSMTFAFMLALLVPVTAVSGWAAEGRGQDARQGGIHAGDRTPRTVERRDRSERKIERWVERRDGMERGDRTPRTVERRDRSERKIERRVERRDGMELRDRGVRRIDDRNRHPGYVLDRRYQHDRYYPPRGYVAKSLPFGYRTFHHHGDSYYYRHGIWYRHAAAGFIVVIPPFGIVVPALPPYYTTVWVGGIPYYYAGGVYYVWRPAMQGYVVSEPPAESSVDTEQSKPGQFYVYPKQGQSPEQQAQDRYECHRWAVDQTGFDPSQPAGDLTESQLIAKRADYRRAITACLEARGYSVK